MRSKALPWALGSFSSVPGWSRMATMPATLESSSWSVTSKVSPPPSATYAVHVPA